jgi:hypothetical protein
VPNGRKCHSPALRGKPFCFHHAKLHFRNSATRKPRELAEPKIQDLRGIQTAVNKAITALNSPLIDTRRAGLLLYGLHLAANLQTRIDATSARERTEGAKSDPSLSTQCVIDTASNVRSFASE